ncbi:DegV family protein [Ruminococcaceae bacterium OttesenSCG-928-O06]|nr:DegV family protein [Ruminococcaceae bacterium OttesenSCG-928-O06]
MANKIILSADSTCDIGPELQDKYNVQMFNYHIQIGDESYVDRLEITPEELYSAWRDRGILPKTAAITPGEYAEYFEKWVGDGYEVVHVNLGTAMSSAYQNCMLAAEELGHIYPVDSASLSTGSAHLVVKAGQMIEAGMASADIQRELIQLREKTSASFILDTLEFMAAGGRCSAITAFGANLLKLKPCIKVDNFDGGRMGVGKKYRGSMEKVLAEYVKDQLDGRNDLVPERIFITHSGSPESDIALVKEEIKKYAHFDEVYVTRASGTISSHCGPRTLGILFMTK